jgi:hypothetical protein
MKQREKCNLHTNSSTNEVESLAGVTIQWRVVLYGELFQNHARKAASF